jgi:hypothetical protein
MKRRDSLAGKSSAGIEAWPVALARHAPHVDASGGKVAVLERFLPSARSAAQGSGFSIGTGSKGGGVTDSNLPNVRSSAARGAEIPDGVPGHEFSETL